MAQGLKPKRGLVARFFGSLLCFLGAHAEYVSRKRWRNRPKFSTLDDGRLFVKLACRRCPWHGLKEV